MMTAAPVFAVIAGIFASLVLLDLVSTLVSFSQHGDRYRRDHLACRIGAGRRRLQRERTSPTQIDLTVARGRTAVR
jgi:hypothetical protein